MFFDAILDYRAKPLVNGTREECLEWIKTNGLVALNCIFVDGRSLSQFDVYKYKTLKAE